MSLKTKLIYEFEGFRLDRALALLCGLIAFAIYRLKTTYEKL
jgi:hypothetical protein